MIPVAMSAILLTSQRYDAIIATFRGLRPGPAVAELGRGGSPDSRQSNVGGRGQDQPTHNHTAQPDFTYQLPIVIWAWHTGIDVCCALLGEIRRDEMNYACSVPADPSMSVKQ